MDLGLLVIRLVIGLVLFGHGAQKLFGWFGGPGLDGTQEMFGSLGYEPREAYAFFGGLTELLAGALLAVGFLTPLAVAMVIGQMLNAIWTVHRPNGFWNTAGGYEYNLVLSVVATGIAFTGPGLLSIDHALGLSFTNNWWGIAALVTGLLVGVVALAGRNASWDRGKQDAGVEAT